MPLDKKLLPGASRRRIEKTTGKELAHLMFEEHKEEMQEYKAKEKDILIADALENIREVAYGTCVECGKYVSFPRDKMHKEVINEYLFVVETCPECGKENWCNVFLVRYQPTDFQGNPIGDAQLSVDARWFRASDVHR